MTSAAAFKSYTPHRTPDELSVSTPAPSTARKPSNVPMQTFGPPCTTRSSKRSTQSVSYSGHLTAYSGVIHASFFLRWGTATSATKMTTSRNGKHAARLEETQLYQTFTTTPNVLQLTWQKSPRYACYSPSPQPTTSSLNTSTLRPRTSTRTTTTVSKSLSTSVNTPVSMERTSMNVKDGNVSRTSMAPESRIHIPTSRFRPPHQERISPI